MCFCEYSYSTLALAASRPDELKAGEATRGCTPQEYGRHGWITSQRESPAVHQCRCNLRNREGLPDPYHPPQCLRHLCSMPANRVTSRLHVRCNDLVACITNIFQHFLMCHFWYAGRWSYVLSTSPMVRMKRNSSQVMQRSMTLHTLTPFHLIRIILGWPSAHCL